MDTMVIMSEKISLVVAKEQEFLSISRASSLQEWPSRHILDSILERILSYVCRSSGNHFAFNSRPLCAKPFRKASRTWPQRWRQSRRKFQSKKSRGLPPTAGPPPGSRLASCRSFARACMETKQSVTQRKRRMRFMVNVASVAWQRCGVTMIKGSSKCLGWLVGRIRVFRFLDYKVRVITQVRSQLWLVAILRRG